MRLTIPVRVATFVSAVSLSAYACGEPTNLVAGIPASLTLVPSTLTLKAIGDSETLTATVYDAEGTVIVATVLFEPSDPSIITVSATGTVTATGVGAATVTASLGDLTKTSDVNVFPVGTDVGKVSGDLQSAVVGTPLPAPLVVEVSDPGNNPVPGIEVTFSVIAGGGSLSVDSDTTDANGQASTVLTLGTGAGTGHRVAAAAGGVGRTEFSATALPDVPIDEMDDIPLLGKAMAYGTIQGGDHQNVLSIGPNYWREMVRAYLACVSFADAQAGTVLDALDASAYAENTIVVFWSDHGQHLGEKRHWRKQALWEESTRVPLAIRLPKSVNGGQSCDRAVSLIDIYPTMLELCNLPNVKGLEGTSLLPQLEDPATRRIEPAITTWHYKNHAARSLNFRYIRYRDGTEELYDHRSDPNEHRNLAGDPKYARIRKKLGAYMPKNDAMPSSMKDGGTDSFGRKVEKLRSDGVPDWLGTETVRPPKKQRPKLAPTNGR